MPKIIVTQAFRFAHDGHRVEQFEPAGHPVETSDACADLAVAEGWATRWTEPEAKHHAAAPANKDAAPKRSTKASAA